MKRYEWVNSLDELYPPWADCGKQICTRCGEPSEYLTQYGLEDFICPACESDYLEEAAAEYYGEYIVDHKEEYRRSGKSKADFCEEEPDFWGFLEEYLTQ